MANSRASDLIETALSEAMTINEDYTEGDILVEWAVVAFVTNPDREKKHAFPMWFSNGELPQHHAIGLLQHGILQLEPQNMLRGLEDEE